MTSVIKTVRLDAVVAAVCPIHGVSVGAIGDTKTVRVDYLETATPQERADADAVVAAFDWSDGADEAYKADQAKLAASQAYDKAQTAEAGSSERIVIALALAALDQFNQQASVITAVMDAALAAKDFDEFKNAVAVIAKTQPLSTEDFVAAIKGKIEGRAKDATRS